MTGLFTLAGATVLLRLGTSIGVLTLARALQGLAAAIVWTASFALLIDTAGRDHIGQLMGTATFAANSGALLGPLVGGFIYEHAGSSALFLLMFSLIAVDFTMPLLIIERKNARLYEAPVGTSKYGTLSETTSLRPPSIEDGVKSDEKLGKVRTIVRILTSPQLLVALLGCFTQASLITSFDAVLPIFVETTFGWSPTASGLIFLTLIVPSLLSPLVGTIVDTRPKWSRYLVAGGFLLSAPCFVALGYIVDNTAEQQVLLAVLLALIGILTSFSLPPVMVEAMSIVVAFEERSPGVFGENGAIAQAYGITNFAYAAGTLVGPFVAGYGKATYGWSQMSLFLGVASGLTSIPTFLFVGGWIGKGKRWSASRVSEAAC